MASSARSGAWATCASCGLGHNAATPDAECFVCKEMRGSLSPAAFHAHAQQIYAEAGAHDPLVPPEEVERLLRDTAARDRSRRALPDRLEDRDIAFMRNQSCIFCGGEGAPGTKVDPELGRTEDNVAFSCTECDRWKAHLAIGPFLSHVARIVAHQDGREAAPSEGRRAEAGEAARACMLELLDDMKAVVESLIEIAQKP